MLSYNTNLLGAEVLDIARAKLIQQGLKRMFDSEPEMDIQENRIRLFWTGERLRRAQLKMIDSDQNQDVVKVELGPVLRPYLIKKYGLAVLGLIALGYVLK